MNCSGFLTEDTDGGEPLGWARMHCEGGALMFLRGEHAVDPAAQGIMLYMYARFDDFTGRIAEEWGCRAA